MRVVMNGLAALKPKTGVGHHVAELYSALTTSYPAEHFELYPGERIGGWIRSANKPKPTSSNKATSSKRSSVGGLVATFGKKTAQSASAVHFALYARSCRFDLYHEPNFVPFSSHLPTIVTVHDLSVLKFPQWHPADRVRYHHKHFLRGLNRARHLIVVSEAVRRELIDELGCPPARVTAIFNGIGPQFVPQAPEAIAAVRAALDLPANYFLCVGTIEPRKNLGTVIRAFADLPAEVRSRCPLVLAGPWGWRADAERDLFERIGKPAGVRHLGYTPAEQLPALYSAARVLLYPSYYEGFGMPPTEMLACGGGVISSTADSLREVLAGHAEFVPADDIAGWRNAMLRAATDDDYLLQLKNNGVRHAAQYTWQRAANETIDVYRRAIAQG